jgi:hypothetical protein
MSGLVTQDWQWEFDGLLLGAGTPYAVTGAIGFLDLPSVRSGFTQRSRGHGGFTEPTYGVSRTYELDFNIQATPTITLASALLALEAGTTPQDGTRPLWFQIPGHGLRLVNAQVTARKIPIDQGASMGLVLAAAVLLYAPDPLQYGAALSASVGLPATSGGLVYPLAYPLTYGTTTAGQIGAANPGSAPVSPVFTVQGPIDAAGFQITSIEDGITIQFTGSLGAGDSLVIDTRTGSVILNGTSDRRALLSATVWPNIPPGSLRTFAFTVLGTYSSLASLTAAWAPAFW